MESAPTANNVMLIHTVGGDVLDAPPTLGHPERSEVLRESLASRVKPALAQGSISESYATLLNKSNFTLEKLHKISS